MEFFQKIAALQIQSDVKMAIRKTAEKQLIISLLVSDDTCGDEARRLIPPLILKGTPEELDEGFFLAIEAPIQATTGLLVNMEAYLKAQDDARRQSAMEKEEADRERKEKEEQKKKYEDALKKAADLEKEGKYREAWMKIPEPETLPAFAEELRKKREQLSAKFSQPNLF